MPPKLPEFQNRMTKTQVTLGWVYLPLHIIAFPLLFSLYAEYSGGTLSQTGANLIYYLVGIAFVFLAEMRFLRDGFDVLADNLAFCISTLLFGIFINYALSYFAALFMLLLDLGGGEAAAVQQGIDMSGKDFGTMKAISIYLAPIVEEVLFRGVVFGTFRHKSRGMAYVVSVVWYCLYQVWQLAAVSGDMSMLLYGLQFVPIAIVTAWSYERTGSIWVPILFHMGMNGMSFRGLAMLQSMM